MDDGRLSARQRRWNSPAARVIALVMLCAGGARAQNVFDSVRTVNGYCHIWHALPGLSSPSDLSYSLCAIDRRPRRLSGPDIPAPTLGMSPRGSVFIAIAADGTVDAALTGRYTITGDTSFDYHVLETVRRWRFESPLRGGVPVRAGLELAIASTGVRNDTTPSHLVWRYVDGRDRNSAIARWVVDTVRPPPLTTAQADSVDAAVLRQLVRLQVLLSDQSQRYCLVASSGDTIAARFPRGDLLPVWPWGLDAKSWRAWSGRCVGRMLPDDRAAMACGVSPIISMAERMFDRPTVPRPTSGRPWVEGDSVRITILATRSGAFLVDTLHVSAGPLPILEQHAVIDSLVPSGNRAAYTFSNCAYAYDIDPGRNTLAAAPLAVIRVSELRHETQLGVFDQLRILMDHGPADAAVFVAYRAGARWPALGTMALETADGRWDFGINLDGGRPDAEFLVYMFRRSP